MDALICWLLGPMLKDRYINGIDMPRATGLAIVSSFSLSLLEVNYVL